MPRGTSWHCWLQISFLLPLCHPEKSSGWDCKKPRSIAISVQTTAAGIITGVTVTSPASESHSIPSGSAASSNTGNRKSQIGLFYFPNLSWLVWDMLARAAFGCDGGVSNHQWIQPLKFGVTASFCRCCQNNDLVADQPNRCNTNDLEIFCF